MYRLIHLLSLNSLLEKLLASYYWRHSFQLFYGMIGLENGYRSESREGNRHIPFSRCPPTSTRKVKLLDIIDRFLLLLGSWFRINRNGVFTIQGGNWINRDHSRCFWTVFIILWNESNPQNNMTFWPLSTNLILLSLL